MLRRCAKIIMVILAMIVFSDVMALQVKSAHDSQTILCRVSEKEFTRVAVKDDRIISVKGRSSAFETKQFGSEGGDDGVVYLRPTSGDHRPFSLFIATESGRHYTLMLSISDVPAENIKIIPVSAVALKAKRWEVSAPYTQTLIDLTRAMHDGNIPEGYAKIDMGKTKQKIIQSDMTMQLRTILRGGYLQGEIWQVNNNSRKPIFISPTNFINGDVRAVSISNTNIPPHKSIRLYRILGHE